MQRKNKKEAGFTLIEMIACLLLLSMFFLLLPRLHIMGIENTHSKGLNDWEWDVFLGQTQLLGLFVVIIIRLNTKSVDA